MIITCDGSLHQCNAMNRTNLRLNNRWQNLKYFIQDNGIKDHETPPADDINTYQVGHNDALEGILHYMKTLEEK
jgi:hypothetical protein